MYRNKTASGFMCVMALVTSSCAMDESSAAIEDTTSELGLSGIVFNDSGNQCTVGGATMHCCPSGSVMIGAHVSKNVFKCALLNSPGGAPFLDTGTQRNGMHSCPFGAVMIGLHARSNLLICQIPGAATAFEYIDGNPATQDNFPMHVCANGFAMAGIHVRNNVFNCDL
jgi:hypothetical protein